MIIRTIGDLIKSRPAATVKREASVTEACKLMAEKNVDALLVLDEIGICGTLSERDVICRCDAKGAPAELMRVDAIMTPKPNTVAPHRSLADAMRIMLEGGFRHLPVVEAGGDVMGMVSMRDIPTEYRLMVERYNDYRMMHSAE